MKIAIIGANSFLASAIIEQLKNNHLILLALVNNFPSDLNYEFVHINIPQEIDYKAFESADVIIYCAAAAVQSGDKSPKNIIYEVNAFEPIRILNHLKDIDFKGTFINFGSYFEIGNNQNETLLDENAFVTSQNILPNDYCVSKKLFTQFVNFFLTQKTFRIYYFVLPNIYGVGENPNRVIPYIVSQITENQSLTFSSGVQKRQYVHVNDIAKLIEKVILEKSLEDGIFNLTQTEIYSVRTVIEQVIALAAPNGYSQQIEFGALNTRDLQMGFLGLDDSKAKKILGWKPEITLKEGIQGYLNR